MKFVLKAVFWLNFLILLCSCASTKSNFYTPLVQSWRGGQQQVLLSRWGKPDKIIKSPQGSIFYLYQSESYPSPSRTRSPQVGVSFHQGGTPVLTTTPQLNINGDRGISLACIAFFEVNGQGMIINAYTQGNGCYASEKLAAAMKNPMKPTL